MSESPVVAAARFQSNDPAAPAALGYSDAAQSESFADSSGHYGWHPSSGLWL